MDPKPRVVGKQLFLDRFVYYEVNIVKYRRYSNGFKVRKFNGRKKGSQQSAFQKFINSYCGLS